jgi:hypothetical protein
MFNFFEQPYTLICTAVLVLFGMLTFRSVFPEKRHWWQLLVPVLVAASACGLDLLVQTDREKINAVIDTGINAIETEDFSTIRAIISENYSDSHHNTKELLLVHSRRAMSQHLLEKTKNSGVLLVELSERDATLIVFMRATFDKNSYIAENYKPSVQIKVRLNVQKQPDGGWLISRIELLTLDRQPINWSQIG